MAREVHEVSMRSGDCEVALSTNPRKIAEEVAVMARVSRTLLEAWDRVPGNDGITA